MKKRIIFRLPDKMHTQINYAIRNGKAKNRSEFIRAALNEFLKPKEEDFDASE
jgi:Arc/MetJ-type ribon-helix-helix transcriptional regulator